MGKMREYKANIVIRELPENETVAVCAQAHDATGHLLYDIVIKSLSSAPARNEMEEKESDGEIGPGGEEILPPPVPAELL